MEAVPSEIYHRILSLGGLAFQGRCELVCKRLRGLVFQNVTRLEREPPPKDRRFAWLAQKPSVVRVLQRVSASWEQHSNALQRIFVESKNLTKITVIQFKGVFTLFNQLASLPLETLKISGVSNAREVLEEQAFVKLRPTLRRLVLADETGTGPNTDLLLDYIAKYFGDTLTMLGVACVDWRPLKAHMKVLKELLIFSHSDLNRFINAWDIDVAIALQREWNPPSVGLALSVAFTSRNRIAAPSTLHTLFSQAIENGIPASIELLLNEGFDPLTPCNRDRNCGTLSKFASFEPRNHLELAFHRNLQSAKVILEHWPGVWAHRKKRPGSSVFSLLFNGKMFAEDPTAPLHIKSDSWTAFATWLLDTRWAAAVDVFSADLLLSGRCDPLPQEITYPYIDDIMNFVLDRPFIFGPQFIASRHRPPPVKAPRRIYEPVDEPPADDKDAMSDIISKLDDEEFRANITLDTIGNYYVTTTQVADRCIAFARRLTQVLDKAQWQEFFSQWMQARWRFQQDAAVYPLETRILLDYDGEDASVIHRLVVRGLVMPFKAEKWRTIYKTSDELLLGLPMPHLLVREPGFETFKVVVKGLLRTNTMHSAQLKSWLGIVDGLGRTCQLYFRSLGRPDWAGPELKRIIDEVQDLPEGYSTGASLKFG